MFRSLLSVVTLTVLSVAPAQFALADNNGGDQGSTQGVAHERALLVGTVILTDDPAAKTLTVSGNASGFQKGQSYVSFGYGAGSLPTGPNACVPPNPNNLSPGQMTLGSWSGNGFTRTLNNVLSGENYAPIAAYGTISIRLDSNPTSNSTEITPARFILQDCASVSRNGDQQSDKQGDN